MGTGRRRYRFSHVLLGLVSLLLLGTVVVIQSISLWTARKNVTTLFNDLAFLSSDFVDSEVDRLFAQGNTTGFLLSELIRHGAVEYDDEALMVPHLVSLLQVSQDISSLSVNQARDGKMMMVSRTEEGELIVSVLDGETSETPLTLREYPLAGYPHNPVREVVKPPESDPRNRPWFQLAVEAGKGAWSNTYTFLGGYGKPNLPGVSFAAPVYDPEGELLAVVTVDFDVFQISRFLSRIFPPEEELFFVLERSALGALQVIAHNNAYFLTNNVQVDSATQVDLVPISEFPDLRVQAFVAAHQTLLQTAQQEEDKASWFSFSVPSTNTPARKYVGAYQLVNQSPDWIVCYAVHSERLFGFIKHNIWQGLLVIVVALVLAILMCRILARRLAHPIEQLRVESEQIARLQLHPKPELSSRLLEIDELIRAEEHMKTSLRSFAKFVPIGVVYDLVRQGREAAPLATRGQAVVMFVDVVGFTSIAEQMQPDDLVQWLSEFYQIGTECVQQQGGVVDKFIGDSVMAFWVAAGDDDNSPAVAATRAALAIQEKISVLRGAQTTSGKPPLFCRIGMSAGEVVIGNLGSPERLNYTVLGDPVNLASRLLGLCGYYEVDIIIGEVLAEQLTPDYLVRPLDRVSVRGKVEPKLVHELVGQREQLLPAQVDLVDAYAQALQAYFQQNWRQACGHLEGVLSHHSQDQPSLILKQRCEEFQLHPPPSDWDGVHRMTTK